MIIFDGISVRFGNRYILKDFNLNIDRGEKVLIFGKSGAGKSTLIRLLLGFTTPESGRIYFEGEMLDRRTVWEIRKRVAYVSQDLDIGEGMVSDIIGEAFSLRATSSITDYKERLNDLLEYFMLKEGIMHKEFGDLSGGEKQRIAIIIALLLQRDIFLLDEVTSALDVRMKERVIDCFTGNPDWTVLILSHDKDWLKRGNVRVYYMEEENGSA